MKITSIPARELTASERSRWLALQSADPVLDSPLFRPEFTEAVAEVRDDVEVALLEEGNDLVGFFPFQRGKRNVGRPVGGRLSDFQGIILAPDCRVEATELLRGCRLSAWHFDHWISSQRTFSD